jgi:hypothetical protein
MDVHDSPIVSVQLGFAVTSWIGIVVLEAEVSVLVEMPIDPRDGLTFVEAPINADNRQQTAVIPLLRVSCFHF